MQSDNLKGDDRDLDAGSACSRPLHGLLWVLEGGSYNTSVHRESEESSANPTRDNGILVSSRVDWPDASRSKRSGADTKNPGTG